MSRSGPYSSWLTEGTWSKSLRIDLEKDILTEFKPRIAAELKLMPQEIFYPEWGKLKQLIEAKRPSASASSKASA
jgi:hypothetical protein